MKILTILICVLTTCFASCSNKDKEESRIISNVADMAGSVLYYESENEILNVTVASIELYTDSNSYIFIGALTGKHSSDQNEIEYKADSLISIFGWRKLFEFDNFSWRVNDSTVLNIESLRMLDTRSSDTHETSIQSVRGEGFDYISTGPPVNCLFSVSMRCTWNTRCALDSVSYCKGTPPVCFCSNDNSIACPLQLSIICIQKECAKSCRILEWSDPFGCFCDL